MTKYVNLIHPKTKEERQFSLGFSWTSLAFGPIVPFFRNEKKIGLYAIAVYPFCFIFVNLWMGFMYNGYFVKRKYEKEGWKPKTKADKERLEDYLYLEKDK